MTEATATHRNRAGHLAHAFHCLCQQPALSDPSLGDDRDGTAFALLYLLPEIEQERELALPTDKRGALLLRFPALGQFFPEPKDGIRRERLRFSLERQVPSRSETDGTSGEMHGHGADDDATWVGCRLQASCCVEGITRGRVVQFSLYVPCSTDD